MPEVGECLVGAYLKLIDACDFVDYNVRAPGGGITGLEELDVVGLRFKDHTAFLCEATTHLWGLRGKTPEKVVERVRKKYQRQQNYARVHLPQFTPTYMMWSPVVPVGYLTRELQNVEGLTLVINGEYKRRVDALLKKATGERQETGNPVFRLFQILGALRE